MLTRIEGTIRAMMAKIFHLKLTSINNGALKIGTPEALRRREDGRRGHESLKSHLKPADFTGKSERERERVSTEKVEHLARGEAEKGEEEGQNEVEGSDALRQGRVRSAGLAGQWIRELRRRREEKEEGREAGKTETCICPLFLYRFQGPRKLGWGRSMFHADRTVTRQARALRRSSERRRHGIG